MSRRSFPCRLSLFAFALLLAAPGASFAQANPTAAPNTVPSAANGRHSAVDNGAVDLPHGIAPNRAELAMSAFNKLDGNNKGYVTRDDVRQLEGFDSAFAQADQNHDGRLNASEFNSAWANYTGNNP